MSVADTSLMLKGHSVCDHCPHGPPCANHRQGYVHVTSRGEGWISESPSEQAMTCVLFYIPERRVGHKVEHEGRCPSSSPAI